MLALHHLAIVVRDLDRAEAFYVGVLGLPVNRRWQDDHGNPRSVWVTLDEGAVLALEKAHVNGPVRNEEAPGLHCLALRIPRADRDVWRARVISAGGSVVRESAFTLYTRDPDGNLVGLSHYPDAI